MFYRPNFCCNCGEKIERVDWPLFASRKFCDLCETEFRVKDLGAKILTAVGIVIATASISSIFKAPQDGMKTATSEPVAFSSAIRKQPDTNFNTTQAPQVQSQTGANANTSTAIQPVRPVGSEPATKSSDAVYYCGAETKKGTACSRRVKRAGERCWQHQGMPAMVAESRTERK
jgi:hypothetical protein